MLKPGRDPRGKQIYSALALKLLYAYRDFSAFCVYCICLLRGSIRRAAISTLRCRQAILVVVGLLVSLSVLVPVLRNSDVALAATSSTLNFQGRLLSNTGSLVPDGTYNFEFILYNVPSGGSALWTDTRYDQNGATAGLDYRVTVKNGYFSVYLGDTSAGGTAFGSNINWDQELWLGMNIGGSTQTATPTWDGEMSPRFKLTAVPYAFQAGNALGVTSNSTSTAATNTNGVTVSTGNSTTSGNTGALTISTGDATSGNSGNITIDTGNGSGTDGTITIGGTNASGLLLGRSGVTAAIQGGVSVAEAAALNGDVTIGDASTDLLTISATIQGSNALIFEGSTADGFETTIAGQDPTADVTLRLPA